MLQAEYFGATHFFGGGFLRERFLGGTDPVRRRHGRVERHPERGQRGARPAPRRPGAASQTVAGPSWALRAPVRAPQGGKAPFQGKLLFKFV